MPWIDAPDFHLRHSLECGQFFGWTREGEGYAIRCGGRRFLCRQEGRRLWVDGAPAGFVRRFLALDHDLRATLRALAGDPRLGPALDRYAGLRILRQDPWESILSFVTSIASNIPRITRNLDGLARQRGKGRLPRPGRVGGEPFLRRLGFGFRARYLAAIDRIVTERDLGEMERMETPALRERLIALPGIAEKVADCVLLYGFGRLDAFPVDTWIRKVMIRLYFRGRRVSDDRIRDLARRRFGPHAGYAQQHLFVHARESARGAERYTFPMGNGAGGRIRPV